MFQKNFRWISIGLFVSFFLLSTLFFLEPVAAEGRIIKRRGGRPNRPVLLKRTPAPVTTTPVRSAETPRPQYRLVNAPESRQEKRESGSPTGWADQLADLCNAAKKDPRNPIATDLDRCKARLIGANNALLQFINRNQGHAIPDSWKEELNLISLKNTLEDPSGPNDEILEKTWNAFDSNLNGEKWSVFQRARDELERFRTVKDLVSVGDYANRIEKICDNLSKYVDEYSQNTEPAYGIALGEVLSWLRSVSVFEPKAEKIANLVRQRLSRSNLQCRVGVDFVAVPFQRNVNESISINENVLGTRVVGSGSMSGSSTIRLHPNPNRAEIDILVNVNMTSRTTGYHSPVSFQTLSRGTLFGTKRIVISPEIIGVLPAQARADLQSVISNLQTNACPLVRCLVKTVAQNRIADQKPASEAEARRRAANRLAERINAQVDPRIAQLDGNFRTKIKDPLVDAGLFPDSWKTSTSSSSLLLDARFGDSIQTASPNDPPQIEQKTDVLVQIHQSMLNNIAMNRLSGREFDEEKTVEDLKKQFKELPKALNRESDQQPIHLTFAEKGPIAVTFLDNKLKAVFRIDSFVQDGSKYPGLDITLLYEVKTSDGKVVFEQAEAPKIFPRGFDPKGGQRISARHQAIRTIITKRLETSLPRQIVAEPRQLKGEWEGKGTLVPAFAASDDGWLTLAWNWVPL